MPLYKIKLLNRQEIANGTLLFTFEKPPGFTFKPGQYGGFTLINPDETDANGNTRRFSLVSSPDDKHLSIAMRISPVCHAYKRILKELPLGSEIKFAGPSGTFILHEDASIPAVLIAGGIGITPFYSMVQYVTQHHISRQIYLFYGNPKPADAAFLNELTQLQNKNPAFKCIATMDKAD